MQERPGAAGEKGLRQYYILHEINSIKPINNLASLYSFQAVMRDPEVIIIERIPRKAPYTAYLSRTSPQHLIRLLDRDLTNPTCRRQVHNN